MSKASQPNTYTHTLHTCKHIDTNTHTYTQIHMHKYTNMHTQSHSYIGATLNNDMNKK
jgi:hypothetical protein